MAEITKPQQGGKIDRSTWEQAVLTANQVLRDNAPLITCVRVAIPIGLIVKTDPTKTLIRRRPVNGKPGSGPVVGYNIGWTDQLDSNTQRVVHYMEYVNQNHPLYGRSSYFQIELRKWDKTKFRKASSGITHLTKNDRGNVVLRQVVVSESALDAVLVKFVKYANTFFLHHCELDD